MKIRMLKKLLYGVVLGVVLFAYTSIPAHAEDLKIGYIDSQRILDESMRGQQTKETLNEYVQSRQKIVDIEEEELRKIQEDISKQGAILSPESKQQKEEQLQRRFMEYQQKVTALQKEIQQRRTEKLEDFSNELERIVRGIGEKEGYSIILNNFETDIIVYAKPSLDLTDIIIRDMDKNIGTEMKEEKK